MHTNTYLRHLNAINADAVTKSNIIGLRKLFNAQARKEHGYWTGRTSPKIHAGEVVALDEIIAIKRPKVTGELHDSGLKLLRDKRYAKRLRNAASIIADLECFRLVGFEFIDSTHCVPLYRAIAKDGQSFTFRNVPWQSGGNGPEVI